MSTEQTPEAVETSVASTPETSEAPTPEVVEESAPPVVSDGEEEAAPAVTSAPPVPSEETVSLADVKAMIRAERKKAADEAVSKHKAELEKEAERQKMDALERLQLETKEAQDAQAAAEKIAQDAVLERDLAQVLVKEGKQLQDDRAHGFLKDEALKMVSSDDGVTMEEAVSKVLTESPWLLRASAEATSSTNAPEAPTAPVVRPSTNAPNKETTAPAKQTPNQGVDVLSMSRAEYEEYRRRTHNLH